MAELYPSAWAAAFPDAREYVGRFERLPALVHDAAQKVLVDRQDRRRFPLVPNAMETDALLVRRTASDAWAVRDEDRYGADHRGQCLEEVHDFLQSALADALELTFARQRQEPQLRVELLQVHLGSALLQVWRLPGAAAPLEFPQDAQLALWYESESVMAEPRLSELVTRVSLQVQRASPLAQRSRATEQPREQGLPPERLAHPQRVAPRASLPEPESQPPALLQEPQV